jgi:hypothetical protein
VSSRSTPWAAHEKIEKIKKYPELIHFLMEINFFAKNCTKAKFFVVSHKRHKKGCQSLS